MRTGQYRPVTKRGKQLIAQAIDEEGVLTSEYLLLCLLLPEERTLNDGKEEYECINGNHRLAVLKEKDLNDVRFVCDICKVSDHLHPQKIDNVLLIFLPK